MPTQKYITIAHDDNSDGKNFVAIQYSPPMIRTDTMDYSLDGIPDKQAGPVIEQIKYTFVYQ